jgi:trehalose-phosphatase
MSGRSLTDLKRRIAFPAALIASHGLEIETREFSFVHLDAEGMRREVDQACWDLRQAFESIGSVEIESKEMSAAVHYRGVSEELGKLGASYDQHGSAALSQGVVLQAGACGGGSPAAHCVE